MSPEVARRKLDQILRYLGDLAPYAGLGREAYQKHHYAVERLLELLVESTCDALAHLLVEKGIGRPDTYRQVFEESARQELIPAELGGQLAPFAGVRNILAHRYTQIDDDQVREAVPEALAVFRAFTRELARHADIPE
jgi:uncharacterized protein YutE (UPF0331/DUF86 family)